MMNGIRFLGAYGGKSKKTGLVSLQIAPHTVIDAGNLIGGAEEETLWIDHVFLTHSHLDHVNDIPYLLDNTFHLRKKPLKIYGTKETLSNFHTHVFCRESWADYTNIPINEAGDPAAEFVTIDYDEPVFVDGVRVTPVENTHIHGSCGFVIEKNGRAVLFSSDTYLCPSLTERIDRDPRIHTAIFEVSFSDGKEELARKSRHLTPSLLEKQLETLRRREIKLYVNHLKPAYVHQISEDLKKGRLASMSVRVIGDGDVILYEDGSLQKAGTAEDSQEKFLQMIRIGTMLTEQTDKNRLYNAIVQAAREFVHADAGTLYMMDEKYENLHFEVVHNDTLNVDGSEKPQWPPLPLRHDDGTPNHNMVAVAAALQGRVINIPDVYDNDSYDFSGAKKFDAMTGYRSKSMLVIPMKNHEEKVIGVLQLINRKGEEGQIVPFSEEDEKITFSLASQAAILMRNQILIHDLEEMLFSFLNALANTLDNKSAFTGRHIERMVDVTMEIAQAIRDDRHGPFKGLRFDEDEMKQIYLAALVHDIGKIVTPDYLVEKSTKLETVFDRVENIRLRMELAKSQRRCSLYKEALEKLDAALETFESSLRIYENRLDDWMRFLEEANKGNEYFSDEKIARLREISKTITFEIDGEKRPLLEEEELEALSVQRGTLTAEERRIIMDHVKETQRNLNQLKFPTKYSRIPEIAGAHHEKLNGKGYPNGLKGDEISLEARILAIADIFEALTASDRPYKKPNKLSEAMKILYFMAKDGELDYDIVKFFYEEKIYLKYAKKHLHPEQIDEVHLEF